MLHRQLPPLASRKVDPRHGRLQAKLLPTSFQGLGERGREPREVGSCCRMQNQHIFLKTLTFLFCPAPLSAFLN